MADKNDGYMYTREWLSQEVMRLEQLAKTAANDNWKEKARDCALHFRELVKLVRPNALINQTQKDLAGQIIQRFSKYDTPDEYFRILRDDAVFLNTLSS